MESIDADDLHLLLQDNEGSLSNVCFILVEILRELQSQRPKLANAKIRYQQPPDTSSNR